MSPSLPESNFRHDAADDFTNRPPRLRFPGKARLNLASEFSRVRTQGAAVHGKLMLLGFLKSADTNPARIGFITSKKVGGAVERNRVRRRLREIIRQARPSLLAGAWIVVIAKPRSASAGTDALREEWTLLAKRAGVLP